MLGLYNMSFRVGLLPIDAIESTWGLDMGYRTSFHTYLI